MNNKSFNRLLQDKAMTLMEILIVVSLIGMIGLAVYKSLSNGLQVWDRSRRAVVEEDIALFFDKLSREIRNAYSYSQINFEGGSSKFSFPSIVRVPADSKSHFPRNSFVDQLGKVEYVFSAYDETLYKRVANYSQALGEKYEQERVVIHPLDNVEFRYYYLTDDGEVKSDQVLDSLPSGIEVRIEFSDNLGQRVLERYIDIPIGNMS